MRGLTMRVYFLLPILLIFSCSTEEIVQDLFDITPPSIAAIGLVDSKTLKIESNEPIFLDIEDFYCGKEIISSINEYDNFIEVIFTDDLIPGKEYNSEITLYDSNGNYNRFLAKFYGFNSNLPVLIINEFICKGTKSNPDKVELYIVQGGNLAGMTLYTGTKESYESKYIFPDISVTSGEYITVRSTSENYPMEFIEIDNLNVDYDKKFNPGSRDIRTNDLIIPGSNGVITVYDNPLGEIVEAVVYTKNINDSEKRYRNFGLSKTLERVLTIEESGLWASETGEIYPNDAINIDRTTTTRSANRREFIDTDSHREWYICPGKESSFGYANSGNIY